MNLNVNDKAPEFTLQDENEKEISLKSLRGKVVVLYFYPRADTPGCTVEACAFRDTYKQMQKTGAVLLGISPDTPKAQKKFQDKFTLPFSLLADADKKVANAFGVLQEKNMYGKKVMGIARTTFVIGPDGKIQHIFPKVKPEGHAVEVLAYLERSHQRRSVRTKWRRDSSAAVPAAVQRASSPAAPTAEAAPTCYESPCAFRAKHLLFAIKRLKPCPLAPNPSFPSRSPALSSQASLGALPASSLVKCSCGTEKFLFSAASWKLKPTSEKPIPPPTPPLATPPVPPFSLAHPAMPTSISSMAITTA